MAEKKIAGPRLEEALEDCVSPRKDPLIRLNLDGYGIGTAFFGCAAFVFAGGLFLFALKIYKLEMGVGDISRLLKDYAAAGESLTECKKLAKAPKD